MNIFKSIINTYKYGLAYKKLESKYILLDTNYNLLVKTFDEKEDELASEIGDLVKENLLLHADLEECHETHIKPDTSTFSLDESLSLLNKKIEQRAFKYPFKGDGKDIDIKYSLIHTYSTIVALHTKKIIEKYNPQTPTECVEAVTKYFIYVLKPKYVTDKEQFGKRDFWEDADTFLLNEEGDCDGTAIAMHVLIKSVLDKQGFPEHYDRLYLHINENWLEAHANNIWLADDGYFYTVESTIGLKETFTRKWLNVPLAYDSFYTKTRGFANLNGSHKGSNALRLKFRNI